MAKASNDLKARFRRVVNPSWQIASRKTFVLADEQWQSISPAVMSALILEALEQRPDLARLRYQARCRREFAKAESKLVYPTH